MKGGRVEWHWGCISTHFEWSCSFIRISALIEVSRLWYLTSLIPHVWLVIYPLRHRVLEEHPWCAVQELFLMNDIRGNYRRCNTSSSDRFRSKPCCRCIRMELAYAEKTPRSLDRSTFACCTDEHKSRSPPSPFCQTLLKPRKAAQESVSAVIPLRSLQRARYNGRRI